MRTFITNTLLQIGIVMLLFTVPQESKAAHIIGGVMTYECTAPGFYTITMKVYRDCQGGGAQFDSRGANALSGTVTVFRGSAIYNNYSSLTLSSPQVSRIQPDENPCLIVPPNVCVEEGIYVFDLILPVDSFQSYTISYQRCCRNGSISNIVSPGEVGATFTVTITPESQLVCNSSPVFDDFPPIVICNNEDLIYDHSATDNTPGRQLVYSLCAPFVGGGTGGLSGDISAQKAPDGIAPDPETAPPYSEVIYRQPGYSFDRPLGAMPALTINPNTGLIQGRPNTVGQFVVGVCVQEYVNGVLMSEIRRDFQFNVANCERKVFADIEADEILNDGTFVIKSCGEQTVTFNNQSTDINFIDEYDWRFFLPGEELVFDTRNVTVTFPDTGVYLASLILNPNSEVDRCRDSAMLEIGVFGAIESNFDFEYDTCVAGPVDFTEKAFTENEQIITYDWNFGDGNIDDVLNPVHTYSEPGMFDVALTVTDNKGCEAVLVRPLPYFPVPALVIAQPDRFVACEPALIRFNNLSEPINEEYSVTWDFGDGSIDHGLSVEHIYEQAGLYSVNIEIVSPLGCETSGEFRNWITVKESPQAGFSFTPQELNDLQKEVFFTNLSTESDGYQWTFGDGSAAFITNPSHEYVDTGMYEVTLIAVSNNGCTDTATAILDVSPVTTYYLPNAFSPNDDGLNDTYAGVGLLKGVRNFQLQIWNRWGELVYETDDPQQGWNGKRNGDGERSPKGVYHCRVVYVGPRGDMNELESFVTLLR